MKKIKILFLFIMTLVCMKSFSQTQIINISTGIDASNNQIPMGSPEDDWQILAPHWNTIPNVITHDNYPENTCNGGWIGANKPMGNFTFRMNFTPYSYSTCNTSNIVSAKIVFTYTNADDQLLNFKVNTGFTYTYSTPLPSFSDPLYNPSTTYTVNIPPSAIVSGSNNLDFEIWNYTPGTGTTPVALNLCAQLEITYAGVLTPIFTTSPSVCYGDPITVTGSLSNDPTISNHVWIIQECYSSGVPIPSSPDYWAWAGVPGIPGTYTFPYIMPGGLTIGCGKYYKIKLAAMNPCSNWGETWQIVHVNCLPGANAGPDQTICSGNCATLNGTSPSTKGISYSWSNGSGVVGTTGQISVCPTATTTYTLTVTKNTTGCVSTDAVTVFVENLDPNFGLNLNTTNSSYMTLTAQPNQISGLPSGFGYMWNVDELDASLNTVFSINSNGMAPCWWNYTSPEVFSGFDGLTYTFTTSPCLPSVGQFKYNTNYRITRGVWSTNCAWKQAAYITIYNRSTGGVSFVEDPDAPDLSGFLNNINNNPVSSSKQGLNLYPNPADNVLNIEYKLADNVSGKILITDLVGRTLKTIVLTEGSLQTQVDINDLISGVYFVNLYESGKFSESKKVIVAK